MPAGDTLQSLQSLYLWASRVHATMNSSVVACPIQCCTVEAAWKSPPFPKKATDLSFQGLYCYKRDCIDQQKPQDSGQDQVLVDPSFKSTRQARPINLDEPHTKLFNELLNGNGVFQASVKELPKLLTGCSVMNRMSLPEIEPILISHLPFL